MIESLNPVADYERFAAARERRALTAVYSLHIHDLLQEPIEVDGVTYDLKVTASFFRTGEKGMIEINLFDLSDELYVYLKPQLPEPIITSLAQFRGSNRLAFDRLKNAIELKALKAAAESKQWEES